MQRIRRNLQVVVAFVGTVLFMAVLVALLLGSVRLAVGMLAMMLWLVLALAAHTHLRAGDAWRSGVRLEKEVRRGKVANRAVSTTGIEKAVRSTVSAVLKESNRKQERQARVVGEGLVTRVDLMDRRLVDIGRELVQSAGRLEARARQTSDEHDAASQDWTSSLEGLDERLEGVGGSLSGLGEELAEHRAQLQRLHHEPLSEIDAMMQLHRRVPLDGPVPLMAGWALSPRGILQLVDLASHDSVRTVVECGSGTSTIFVGALLRDRPNAKVVALEHLEEFAEQTQAMVDAHDLQHVVEVRHSPLVEVAVQGQIYQWYDPAKSVDLTDIHMLIVDGPPRATGRNARFPAVPLFLDRLAEDAVVILDDVIREEEARIARRWEKHTPGLERGRSASSDQAVLHWSRAAAALAQAQSSSEDEGSTDR